MESVLNCGAHSWPMMAGAVLTFAVLALGAASLIKYLFSASPQPKAA